MKMSGGIGGRWLTEEQYLGRRLYSGLDRNLLVDEVATGADYWFFYLCCNLCRDTRYNIAVWFNYLTAIYPSPYLTTFYYRTLLKSYIMKHQGEKYGYLHRETMYYYVLCILLTCVPLPSFYSVAQCHNATMLDRSVVVSTQLHATSFTNFLGSLELRYREKNIISWT